MEIVEPTAVPIKKIKNSCIRFPCNTIHGVILTSLCLNLMTIAAWVQKRGNSGAQSGDGQVAALLKNTGLN